MFQSHRRLSCAALIFQHASGAVSGASICWRTGSSQCQRVRETLLPRRPEASKHRETVLADCPGRWRLALEAQTWITSSFKGQLHQCRFARSARQRKLQNTPRQEARKSLVVPLPAWRGAAVRLAGRQVSLLTQAKMLKVLNCIAFRPWSASRWLPIMLTHASSDPQLRSFR